MNKPKPEPLDPLIEGYLAYLQDVSRKAWGTIKDVRCTLRRVCGAMESLHPGQPLFFQDSQFNVFSEVRILTACLQCFSWRPAILEKSAAVPGQGSGTKSRNHAAGGFPYPPTRQKAAFR